MPMTKLNAILLWIFMASIGLFIVVFTLYVASFLLPIILVVMVVSGLANLFIRGYQARTQPTQKVKIKVKNSKTKPEIIDAEYEIIDDK